MIHIQENISLKALNTFGIQVSCRYFTEIHSEEEFKELIQHPAYRQNRRFILGGGSNVLFRADFEGLVIRTSVLGKHVDTETSDSVVITVGSGENWHELVQYCISNDWGGIENLSLIPGTVGAAPMQNIGAYGVEIKNVIERVAGMDLDTGARRTFTNEECRFSYRESVFKQDLKEKFFISSVTLRLTKKNHRLNTSYGAIQEVLKRHQVDHPTIRSISDAVISIRRSKLPDPAVIGNAGSFFKNPTVPLDLLQKIKKTHPEIPSYPVDNQSVKIPAGWLIQECGWKGKRMGDIGVHEHQALVLVNFGNGKGEDIFQLAQKILLSVREKFGVTLTMEVNIV